VNIRERDVLLFIITDKTKVRRGEVEGVSVMKDEDLRLEEIESSHTLTRMLSRFLWEDSRVILL
jgi:DNA-directed RNA polymerase subunit L